MIKRILIYTALSILLLSCQEANVGKSNQFSKDILHFLKNSEKFELLSLDPYKNKDLINDFHGYQVLGKVALNMETRNKLIQELLKGMDGAKSVADCFNPRHGIRANHKGKTIDLVICFECLQIYLYKGFSSKANFFLVKELPKPIFDSVLKEAGILNDK